MALIPGRRIVLADGNPYIIPPLTFRQMRAIDDEGLYTLAHDSSKPKEAVEAAFEVIHRAVVRNYPDITVDQMADLLDAGLVPVLFEATMGKDKPQDRTSDPKA